MSGAPDQPTAPRANDTAETFGPLFRPLRVGRLEVPNRIFMAPLTRGRARPDGAATELMARYYAQRAAAGLLVAEATSVSAQGHGWYGAPGLFRDAHVEAWRRVTEAVHAAGGRIFVQLWHMGRMSHPDHQPAGGLPVAPSALAPTTDHSTGWARTAEGRKACVVPRALGADELPGIARDFAAAARRALEAGFDGVELHAANGYLLDTFLRDGSNRRRDDYGGSVENRWRFPLEVVQAVGQAVGFDRVGVRLSPVGTMHAMRDSDPVGTFTYGARQLAPLGLAYVHVLEARAGRLRVPDAPVVHPHLRAALASAPTAFVLNGGYTPQAAAAAVVPAVGGRSGGSGRPEGQASEADAIAFGLLYLANPDLVERLRAGLTTFNEPDPTTFYTPGPRGYTDYPVLSQGAAG